MNTIYNIDAREISKILNEEVVDVTISSPPYFDLKDYGYEGQIGYGQQYEQYLNDLKVVFEGVYNCTKNNGTLWIIIDAFRRDDEVIPLPFDFSKKMTEIGWKLQEIIIWEKDKTVPWAHQGQMRNIFEYILFFSKSKEYTFHIDRVRDYENLKKWWVKYPERYNPKGKTPTGIWEFEIPTQGSWGNSYKSHFCPLPERMIEQIIKISTDENSVVLDPFAGSGTVPAVAHFMKRRYLGFELNPDYIEMFNKYISDLSVDRINAYEKESSTRLKQNQFQTLILNLRTLKYAKTLQLSLRKKNNNDIKCIFVEKKNKTSIKNNVLLDVKYYLLVTEDSNIDNLKKEINSIISKAPLSKFGIAPEFDIKNVETVFNKILANKTLYAYSLKSTHCFTDVIQDNTSALSYPIISEIMVNLNEKDYE